MRDNPFKKWMITGDSPILSNLQIQKITMNQWIFKRGVTCSGGATVPPGLRIWVGVWTLAPSHLSGIPKSSTVQKDLDLTGTISQ